MRQYEQFGYSTRRITCMLDASRWMSRAAPTLNPGRTVTRESHAVLLVEDNEDNRIIYATALRYAGYEVLEAITGTEGVALARQRLPDLILMDISIPEIDGWEATAILKADPATQRIPIIAVTAHALPGDRQRSIDAGCDGYLAKPITPAMLIAEVDRRLGLTSPSYPASAARSDTKPRL